MQNRNLYITPGERKGFLLLTLLVLLSHSGIVIYEWIVDYSDEEKEIILQTFLNQNSLSDKEMPGIQGYNLIPPAILRPINPNSIDTSLLPFYGLSEKAIINLEKYRKAGGSFKYREDLLKIYYFDTLTYQNIYDLIDLPRLNEKG